MADKVYHDDYLAAPTGNGSFLTHQTIGKVFDYFFVEHNLFTRWGGRNN